MARYRHWRCPDCGGTFKHLHHPDDAPPPDRCLLCGAWMSETEPVFVPQAPAVGNPARVKAVDDVYYGMEDATKARAELMARHTPGASASDFSHTLITDMNDRQKPGDIAWKPPPPSPVTQQMEFLKQRGANVGFGAGSGIPNYAPDIPLTGDAARQQMTRNHHQMVRELVAGGQIGSYSERRK